MNVISSFVAPLPQMADVQPDGNLTVRVSWRSGLRAGKTERVDLSPLINSLRFYRPLREDVALFGTVRVSDGGDAIEWGDGALDMAAESIERLAEESMTADDFRAFLDRHKLTHRSAAANLGRSLRQIENYLSGAPIPRVVVLACFGYAERRRARQSQGWAGRIVSEQTIIQTLDRAELSIRPKAKNLSIIGNLASAWVERNG